MAPPSFAHVGTETPEPGPDASILELDREAWNLPLPHDHVGSSVEEAVHAEPPSHGSRESGA